MRLRYQRGCLRCIKRKSGPDCWEFLWRENDTVQKRVRRTAVIGTVEEYPTKDLAQAAVNGLRMCINEDRNRQQELRVSKLDQGTASRDFQHRSQYIRWMRLTSYCSKQAVCDLNKPRPFRIACA